MEQKKPKDSSASSASEPPSHEPAWDNDRSPTPTTEHHHHSHSLDAPADPTTPTSSTDSREPTLRFPRPQANNDLINWISNSDPDIMRLTTTSVDDNGLAGSTYELVHEERERDPDSESQSQDDNYTESNMTESVGSLGYGRVDDVQSLAGTETGDTESNLDEDMQHHTVVVVPADLDEEDYGADTPQEQSENGEETDGEDSHASLEFTKLSLGAPSCRAPAFEEFDLPDDPQGFRPKPRHLIELISTIAGSGIDALASADLRMVCISSAVLLLSAFASLYFNSPGSTSSDVAMLTASVTTTAAVVAPTTVESMTGLSTSAPQAGMALIPIDKSFSTEWFSRTKPDDFNLAPRGFNQVFIALPADIKVRWEENGCLSATASRGEDPVVVTISFDSDGAVFRFPRRESYGVVRLTVQSSCRPAISKTVKIHFGKGVVEEVLDYTKNIALGVGQYIPVVVQETEKRFELAKRSLGSLSQHVYWSYVEAKFDQVVKSLNVCQPRALQVWSTVKDHASHAATLTEKVRRSKCVNKGFRVLGKQYHKAQDKVLHQASLLRADISTRISSGLAENQIAAKLWWLKVTGRLEEYNTYGTKAQGYLAKLQEQRKTMLARGGQGFCQGRAKNGLKFTKDCKKTS